MIKHKQTSKEILKNCRFATPSTPHHLNLNCSTQLKLVHCIVDWILKLFQFMHHCINYFLENFNFYYSSCCSITLRQSSSAGIRIDAINLLVRLAISAFPFLFSVVTVDYVVSFITSCRTDANPCSPVLRHHAPLI
ncbi:hypothetical protein T05_2640 [Trichinella murrelli]|uniref:Uncharacterized protein n=1 Tax=Trichinella murrelli TaxID=144512 RepID=A0A0V0TZP3_9BILA|nr:hypothetical protein T05_2640 [Trichinella murrelli]